MKQATLNVVSARELKGLLGDITELTAEVLGNTFGPYGQNTLIQTTATIYATKDGWNVMQNLRVTDEKGESSITANALKKLIQDVAQATLLNAGDGTTTSILAAASLNRKISEYIKKHPMDCRTIENTLKTCTALIEKQLYKNCTMIDSSNMADIIYRIALISTNWDEEISGLIRDIYVKTNNPIIKVDDSGSLETYAEYIEGYELVGHLELPNFYLTSPAKGLFEATKPLILAFSSAVHKDKLDAFVMISSFLEQQNRKLVILAPTFDLDFLNTLQAYNGAMLQQRKPPVSVIPIKYYAKTDIDKDCVEDFTTLTGGILITNEFREIADVFDKLKEVLKKDSGETPRQAASGGSGPKKYPAKSKATIEKEREDTIMKCIETLDHFGGTCEKLTATDKYILASGLTEKDTEEFNRRKERLENEISAKLKQYTAESTLTDLIRVKRLRLGKMQCNMGVIKVGGFGTAHLKARKDAIDDATRSCEVAFQDGYIPDGAMAIPIAIEEIRKETPTTEENLAVVDFLELFGQAYQAVARKLFMNKYYDTEKVDAIIEHCLRDKTSYDLIKEEYTNDLITPVRVCKEVLDGCLRLVIINATSNQFVFMNEDDLIRAIQSGSKNNEEDQDEDDD